MLCYDIYSVKKNIQNFRVDKICYFANNLKGLLLICPPKSFEHFYQLLCWI